MSKFEEIVAAKQGEILRLEESIELAKKLDQRVTTDLSIFEAHVLLANRQEELKLLGI